MRIIPIKQFSLVGAFSDRAQAVSRRLQIGFHVSEKEFSHEFYIVENVSYQMILGVDFLSQKAAILKWGREFNLDFPGTRNNNIRFKNKILLNAGEDRKEIAAKKQPNNEVETAIKVDIIKFFDPLPQTPRGNRYILGVMDRS